MKTLFLHFISIRAYFNEDVYSIRMYLIHTWVLEDDNVSLARRWCTQKCRQKRIFKYNTLFIIFSYRNIM